MGLDAQIGQDNNPQYQQGRLSLPAHDARGIESKIRSVEIRPQQLDAASRIQRVLKCSSAFSRILAAHGQIAGKELTEYLSPDFARELPPLEQLKGLAESVTTIKSAIDSGRAIAICCDYDLDGLSAGAQLYLFLKAIGVNVKVYVPDPLGDGYGLTTQMVDTIHTELPNCGAMVTLDFGTKNGAEILYARSFGIESVVIDHHVSGDERPPTAAFINPKQTGCGYAGELPCSSLLVHLVIMKLKQELPQAQAYDERRDLDLVALGTIADLVPLTRINRAVVRDGLRMIEQSDRIGLKILKLYAQLNGEVSSTDVAFRLAPRLNVGKRLGLSAEVLQLLTTSDPNIAEARCQEIDAANHERKGIQHRDLTRALEIIGRVNGVPDAIVVGDPSFHPGTCGVVAARLVELFGCPVVVLAPLRNGSGWKGSARSVSGVDISVALKSAENLLVRHGGHAEAGGLTIEEQHVPAFTAQFLASCNEQRGASSRDMAITADTLVKFIEVDQHFLAELKRREPCGQGNRSAVLAVKDAEVRKVEVVKGQKDDHLRVVLYDGHTNATLWLWGKVFHPALHEGAIVTAAFRAELREYRGMPNITLSLEAVQEK